VPACTTNAIVPPLKAIEDEFGIVQGHVETVHSFTNDQNLLDNFHKGDRRGRSRAAQHGAHRDRCRLGDQEGDARLRGAHLRLVDPGAHPGRLDGDPQPAAQARDDEANHPKADLALLSAPTRRRADATASRCARAATRTSPTRSRSPRSSPTRHDRADAGARRCCTTRSRTRRTRSRAARDFGDEVAQLVDGVTKLDKVKYGDSAQAETIRKMIVAMARDIRVLGHQARRPAAQHAHAALRAGDKQERRPRETLEIYAPLAHRLGMNTIKWELEDLAFATLHPKRYDEIVRLVADRAPSRDSSSPR
jgi:guanosine-3',5'-bis(diphosphate) 3'-pyrophosphohydrolase